MKIAKYVGDLLFDYECVVIPGLGGFITEDKSVSVNEFTHKFKPPFRKVYFNARLRANDGMLINHVAQQEQLDYKVAKTRVDNFAFQCKAALDNGKRINFKDIGYLYQDNEMNIVFHQDSAVNYNPDSFGLSSVVSHAIQRESDEEKVKKVIKSAIENPVKSRKREDRKLTQKTEEKKKTRKMEASKRLSSLSKQVIFLLIVFAILGGGYLYMRRDAMGYYLDRYASQIPFFYSSVNDYLASNINSTPVASLSRNTASLFPAVLDNENTNDNIEESDANATVESTDTYISETPVQEDVSEQIIISDSEGNPEKLVPEQITSEVIDNDVVIAEPAATVSVMKYYVIAGSFSKEDNAIRLVKELRSKGYEALIADTNKYSMYRVAFLGTNDKRTAEIRLSEIKNNYNPKAWILSKNN